MAPIVTAIKQAKKSIDVLIFRLDLIEIARALEAAVARGVHVRALTAHTNRGGAKTLRALEMHLLEGGVTVSRTADDLIRYHGKMMIVDGRTLHVYGFNFTQFDMEKSRSFGVISKNPKLVSEAMKLFSADFDRQPYVPSQDRLVVSPENSRERLAAFLKGARRELLIYDPKATDDAILRIIEERIAAGVVVKMVGRLEAKWADRIPCEKYPGKRLHVRAIIRDGRRGFVGSQSLRRIELDKRREIGVIVNDQAVVDEMRAVFQSDWARTDSGRKEARKAEKASKKEEKLLEAAS